MKSCISVLRWLAVIFLVLGGSVLPLAAELPVVRIGVVIDGPWSIDHQQVLPFFQREVVELTRGEFDVRFPADKTIISDATVAGIKRDLDRLLDDPEVDLVIAGGVMASHEAGRRRDLPKPVVAPVVVDALVQGIPLRGQVSGVKNLSFVSFPVDIQHDLKVSAEVVPLKRVAMLHAAAIGRAVPELVAHYVEQAAQVGVEVQVVAAAGSAESLLELLGADIDGVFIALPLHLSPADGRADRRIARQFFEPADSTTAYESKHYPLLQVPQLLWRGLVYPLGQFTIYAEHTKLPQRVNNWFTNEAGTFGIFPQVQLGGEAGSGAGARIFHTQLFGADAMAEALFVASGEGGQTGAALFGDESIAAGRGYWRAEMAWLKTRNEGATVNGGWYESELRLLQLKQLDIVSTLGWRLHAYETESFTKNTFIEGRVGFGRRRLTERFNVELPFVTPRYTAQAHQRIGQGETIALFSAGVRLAYDDRDYSPPTKELSHPLNYQLPGRILHQDGELYHSFRDIYNAEAGGLAELEFDFFSGNKDARFIKIGAEVQRFFSLFWRYRVLALRARLDKVSALGDESIVPYVDLVTLGGSQRLRGYRRGAMRGEGALLLSAEYRWPIWDTWSAYLFWDEGQVFDRYGDIEGGSFLSSWGGGINLRTAEAFLIGLRIGHSEAEDALVGFTLEQEF